MYLLTPVCGFLTQRRLGEVRLVLVVSQLLVGMEASRWMFGAMCSCKCITSHAVQMDGDSEATTVRLLRGQVGMVPRALD